MKSFVKKIISFFGYDIKRINQSLSFDDIYLSFFKNDAIIFDVGANKGQSIERFKKIFPNSIIHAFEPIKEEFDLLKTTYDADVNVKLSNIAVGDKVEKKKLNIAKRTGVSSFNEFNKETDWIKTRSKEYNTNVDDFITGNQIVDINTLDNYVLENNISNIDILKIDTQGYEDKVLLGCKNSLSKKIIKAVELEIIFDNTYDRYLTFSEIEKYLLPNYRFVGIKNYNQNLFEGINFFAEVLYINKKLLK